MMSALKKCLILYLINETGHSRLSGGECLIYYLKQSDVPCVMSQYGFAPVSGNILPLFFVGKIIPAQFLLEFAAPVLYLNSMTVILK